ncbi:Putative ribonuclease H protein At1g65750 [Linum perenne]
MTRKLQQLWARKGRISVWDIGFGHFVARFDSEEDYLRALLEGPWLVGDHYVLSEEWRPNFEPGVSQVNSVRVWIRLPGIPLENFDMGILKLIGDRIGKTIRVDTFRMEATQNLGKYLGVPIIHGRNSKELYNFLLERMDAKLAGWKRKSLSQAGRVSLAQSVLNSLPSYVMQTTLLPVDICNKLDKKVRDFVWGSEEGERKMHLINWQKVCSPKNQGGLGLRSSREMNHALLMKLIWKMLKHPEELWVSVLMTKYFDRTSEGLRPRKSKRWSSCWKGLQETWPTFQGGLYWGIRNGRKTNFWTERWLDNGSILSEQCTPPSDRIVDKVADYCTTDGNWDLELLSSFLPNTLMEEVVGMTPPCDELEDDIPVWGLEPNGCYSVRSGYLLSIGLEDYNGMSIWKRIWRWEGPQRVRQFLWLAVNDRLLTNAERHRRHLATSTDCNLCHEVSEDVTHILRDCPPAKET